MQNQNPLDPLDTNQFTQQLVQFAGVEQQLRQNEQLKTLIALQKSTQSTQALAYVGNTVAVDGSKAQFDGSAATWNINAPADSNVTITIANAAGQTAFSRSYSLNQGNASFSWDGKGNDGVQWPQGTYTLTATGKDQAGKSVAISTEVAGRGQFRRPHRLAAAALDRRSDLHHRPDQARGAFERQFDLSRRHRPALLLTHPLPEAARRPSRRRA